MTSATSTTAEATEMTTFFDDLDLSRPGLLPPTSTQTTTTKTTTTTCLDLNRDVLSEIFSHLRYPEDLVSVACVCRHWRLAAEGEGEGENSNGAAWRRIAESLGLGLKPGEGSGAVAATLDRRALRSAAPALPSPPSSSWKARVRAAWPELCFECRMPDSGRRMAPAARSKQQQQEEEREELSDASAPPPPRTLSIRQCHSCSSASALGQRRGRKTRLVDAQTALRILRSSASGDSDDGDDDEEEGEQEQKSNTSPRLLLLLSRLPRALDVRPQDPRFRTVELFRRRDVRAVARGFERDVFY